MTDSEQMHSSFYRAEYIFQLLEWAEFNADKLATVGTWLDPAKSLPEPHQNQVLIDGDFPLIGQDNEPCILYGVYDNEHHQEWADSQLGLIRNVRRWMPIPNVREVHKSTLDKMAAQYTKFMHDYGLHVVDVAGSSPNTQVTIVALPRNAEYLKS